MTDIVYTPWPRAGDGQGFVQEVADWNASIGRGEVHRRTKALLDVCYGDPGQPLANVKRGASIYVEGHGASGDHEVVADHHGSAPLKYNEVCDRLIGSGLQRSWLGTIKFLICDSAVPKIGKQSFAAKASQYFRLRKGYLLISFVGYLGPVDGVPNFDNGSKHAHRWVTMFGREVKSKYAEIRF
jgi:hypothetical protein